jgi:hypothetical protein
MHRARLVSKVSLMYIDLVLILVSIFSSRSLDVQRRHMTLIVGEGAVLVNIWTY